jgi:transposase
LSIVAGKSGEKVIAPMVYKGTADSVLFETWFEKCFCPQAAGNICIMDNASIHSKRKLQKIAEKFDIILLFQPPYSPDLNKIEQFWAWLKKTLRSVLRLFDSLMEAVCYCFQLN